MTIHYKQGADISVPQIIDLYRRSTLGARRPIDRPDIFEQMLRHSNLIISAWQGEHLVGIARSLTDFGYVAYMSDLAVDSSLQRQGIGKRLIAETQARLGPDCKIVLIAAPAANEYYPRIGFEHNPRAWVLSPG
jgi:ribosomal protein S18 acetylase RimI-like enzyme